MLVLIGLALPVGAISAVVAKALLWLIAEITNIVFFQRFSSQLGSLQHNQLGAWVILAPVAGALIIGLMARFSASVASGDPLICTRQGTLLGNEGGELVGIITRGDVVRAFERSGDPSVTVVDAGSTNLIVAYEDEILHDAIARMLRHDVGRLPVVDRANEKNVVGYLARSSIMAARERYHRDEQLRERGLRKAKLIELQNV
jgi:CBS domain-containing protein